MTDVAILTADWHLTEAPPLCRTDKELWIVTMQSKLNFIKKLALEKRIPVWHAGDLFDSWKPTPFMLSMAINCLPPDFYMVLGNHDLPQHSLDLLFKTGVATLAAGNFIGYYPGFHWGEEITGDDEIIMAHVMTYEGKPWPGCTDLSAVDLLKKHEKARVIITGHNHHGFVTEYQGRILVNPGSILRMTADQQDYKPRVYILSKDGEQYRVTPVYLPILENAVTREHIDIKKDRDSRIDSFIESLQTNHDLKISLEENLRNTFAKNKVPKPIQDIIWNALEGVKWDG